MSHLVLLGYHRHGLSTVQCLPTTVPTKRWQKRPTHSDQHRLPQLRHHLHRWRSGLDHSMLHCGHQIYRPQGHHRRLNLTHRNCPFPLHHLLEPELPDNHVESRSFLPEHYVWCPIRIVSLRFSSLDQAQRRVLTQFSSTPEVFPAPNRGTGTGIASFLNRITGLCAPIVAVHAGGVNPNAPVYAAGGLILAAFLAMCLFPIETRGKQSL
jgi:hypothetical protein